MASCFTKCLEAMGIGNEEISTTDHDTGFERLRAGSEWGVNPDPMWIAGTEWEQITSDTDRHCTMVCGANALFTVNLLKTTTLPKRVAHLGQLSHVEAVKNYVFVVYCQPKKKGQETRELGWARFRMSNEREATGKVQELDFASSENRPRVDKRLTATFDSSSQFRSKEQSGRGFHLLTPLYDHH